MNINILVTNLKKCVPIHVKIQFLNQNYDFSMIWSLTLNLLRQSFVITHQLSALIDWQIFSTPIKNTIFFIK